MDTLIVVRAAFDDDAKVWYVEHSDLFGVNAEAPSLEILREKLPAIISDLLIENDPARARRDMVVEIIAHAHAYVPAAA